jgi:ATP-binding cassette subfamily C (CFTR/MRP) protein 1
MNNLNESNFAFFLCGNQPFVIWSGSYVTICFTDIVLFLPLFVFFGILGSVRLYRLRKYSRENVPWNTIYIIQLLICFLIVGSHLFNIVGLFVFDELTTNTLLSQTSSALCWLYSYIVMRGEYKRRLKHNWVLKSFWSLAFLCQSVRVRALTSQHGPMLDIYVTVFTFVLYGAMCIIALVFNREPPLVTTASELKEEQLSLLSPEEKEELEREMSPLADSSQLITPSEKMWATNPEENANIFSRITYLWLYPLLKRGYRRCLVQKDLYPLRSSLQSQVVTERLERHWFLQLQQSKPSLFKALVKSFGLRFAAAGALKIGNDIGIFAGPFFLQKVIQFVEGKGDEPLWVGVMYASGILLGAFVVSLFINAYFLRVYRVGMNVRAALVDLIYRKAFRLSVHARSRYSIGDIVNHQSVDAQKLQDSITYLHMIWSAPVQITISLLLLWRLLGVATLAGVAVMILLIPINLRITRILIGYQKELMATKDVRTKVTNEILQGIRVIKFFAWENSFVEKVAAIRRQELGIMRKSAFLRCFTAFLWSVSPLLVSVGAFTMFTVLGNTLSADIAFTSLALFNLLRFPLNMAPNVINNIIQSSVSLKRIEKYLLDEELDPIAVIRGHDTIESDEDTSIQIQDGTFFWKDADEDILKNINLKVKKGSLVAVIGAVGSGKSSLLCALLGEMPKKEGTVIVNGSVAYVAQQAWIRNATLRDNILFGAPFDPEKYNNTIKVCELIPDIEMLPGGDLTEIGEKGINLSGGQKQRVSLARAVYQQSDIYLLDDPLSAVDAHVGRAIFENCIKGTLNGTTRVLVTHQLQFLPFVDYIVVMKKGRIVEMGTYRELMDAGLDFAALITTHVDTEQREADNTNKKPEEKGGAKSEEKKKEEQKTDKKSSGPTKLMTEEDRAAGNVQLRVYKIYFLAFGVVIGTLLVLGYLTEAGMRMGSDWWLSYWSDQMAVATTRSVYFYLGIYVLFAMLAGVMVLVNAFLLIKGGINASTKIHNTMLLRVLRSPCSFFDTTPLGRILNRFSKDINAIDDSLPSTLSWAMRTTFGVVSPILVIAIVTPFFLTLLLPLSFIYKHVQQLYLRSSRELQRLESVSRSPVFSMFAETIGGLTTIRAYERTTTFVQQNERLLDANLQAYDASIAVNRWLSLNLDMIGALIAFGAALLAVLSRDAIPAGLAGISITYALNLTTQLNFLVRVGTDMETQMVSVERCHHFQTLPQEAPPIVYPRPPPDWPNRGEIKIQNLSLRYRPGLPLVLINLSCEIKPREKIGVVGRTGAGKSSLMTVLFRLVEPESGKVIIDDVDIGTIGLDDLRSRLAIIPQDPTLFTGTIRSNLDPFNQHSDDELWKAIEAVQLTDQIPSLDSPVLEYGENLSVGTRQLLCLARAIVRNPKILVLDEATASVDFETDALIQKTIRKQFKNCTVLTIAHRVNTILDSDRILVMDKGQIVEFDTPQALLRNPNSLFTALAKKSQKKASTHDKNNNNNNNNNTFNHNDNETKIFT